jgi:type VI secretion system secreted protein VgrG
MPDLTQENRLLELITPLGKDQLLIRSIEGVEGLSQLFSFQVDAFAPNTETIDFSKLVGQPACVCVQMFRQGEPTRFFHGMIQTVARGARGDFNTAYTLQTKPYFPTKVSPRYSQNRPRRPHHGLGNPGHIRAPRLLRPVP